MSEGVMFFTSGFDYKVDSWLKVDFWIELDCSLAEYCWDDKFSSLVNCKIKLSFNSKFKSLDLHELEKWEVEDKDFEIEDNVKLIEVFSSSVITGVIIDAWSLCL